MPPLHRVRQDRVYLLCVWSASGEGRDTVPEVKANPSQTMGVLHRGGEWADNPFYDPDAPEYDGEWKNWNPPKIWTCNSKGLGMGKVFDMVNELYGKEMYRY